MSLADGSLVPANSVATAVPAYLRRPGAGSGGLYDPAFEHDACGVAFVADLAGRRSHEVVANALTALRNLEHRGATGREIDTGDGAGLLTQIPDEFFRGVVGFELPALGSYAVGIVFLPTDDEAATTAVDSIERIVAEESLQLIGWRELPVVPDLAGPSARAMMPRFRQLFVAPIDAAVADLALERLAYRARKRIEHEAQVYVASLSSRTTVRSTPSKATATGCAPAKACWPVS